MDLNAISPLAPSLAPTPDSASSDGTSGKLFDEDALPKPDPETQEEIIAKAGDSAKYGQGLLNQGIANAYGNNDAAIEYARFSMKQQTFGTNPFQSNDFNKLIAQQQATNKGYTVGESLWGLA